VKPRALLDVRTRRALAQALDKQSINEALIAGKAVFYQIQITPHVAALRGPMARVVPDAAPEVFNIYEWSWRS